MSEELDFKNWRDFDQATLRRIFGEEKYLANQEAANQRRSMGAANFLKGFAGGLLSPVTNTLGLMGVPGAIGFGYTNQRDPNKVFPQPWIIDEDTGAVIANPALGIVDDYNKAHEVRKDYLGSNNPYQIVENDIAAANNQSVIEKVDEFLSPTGLTKEQWLHKTRNSPAQRSGAWDSPEGQEKLWQQHLKHQDWLRENNRGPYRVKDDPTTPNNEAKEAARKVRFDRRNKRLVEKGLKPIKWNPN